METLLHELRVAARRLRRAPGFTVIVVLTLALGIGANTAIFSVVNSLLLKPLPYPEPARLATIEHHYPGLNDLHAPVSAAGFRKYRDDTRSFESVAVETGWGPALTGYGEPQRLRGARVSGLWFRTYGVAPALGRAITPADDEPGANQVVVLSDGLWRRVFGADGGIIGRKVLLNGTPYDVIGVMPRGFEDFYNRDVELFTPVALTPEQFAQGWGNEYLSLTARLKPGVTTQAAAVEMDRIAVQVRADPAAGRDGGWGLTVTSLDEKAKGKLRPVLLVLLGAVGFVLLIACANVANLLLVRATGRVKETAIRAAMGAERWQVVRGTLTESVLLAALGGGLGLLLAGWGVSLLPKLAPERMRALQDVGIDGVVLVFTLVVAVLTGLVFGLVPALQSARPDLQETLREGGRGGTADRSGLLVRRLLVVAEVALALTLLTGAGLLVRSFARLQGVDPGFDPKNVLTFQLALPSGRYPSDTAQIAFFDQVLERLATVPGVKAAGATSVLPFGGSWSTGSFAIENLQPKKGEPGPWGDIRVVSPDFLRTLRVPLLKGRTFTPQDRLGAPPVAVVDEELVRRYWPAQDPIGKRITFDDPTAAGDTAHWISVVGVVGHTKHEGLDADARVQLYLPYEQNGSSVMSVVLRTAGDPNRVVPLARAAVQAVDRDQPLARVRTLDSLVGDSLGERRLSMTLLAAFATVALLLAALGIYGIMAHLVTQRTRELGVRMALGAATGDVLGLVLRQGMGLAAAGIAFGLVGALSLTRLMTSQLYSVRATDPATFATVAVVLGAVALLATAVPALRAARVDPVEALRQE
ncbi:MAG TPA: ABC transporter permease [Longimicrobiales bacterium]|nr:ABC transporter permease [Longimicrobiales bacterium]